jgi:hypothetical protein
VARTNISSLEGKDDALACGGALVACRQRVESQKPAIKNGDDKEGGGVAR